MKITKEQVLDYIAKNCEVSKEPNEYGSFVITKNGCYLGITSLIERGDFGVFNILVRTNMAEVYSTYEERAESGVTYKGVANFGFSVTDNKWYGWSHRAWHGFTIGSECKKGHVHYRPANKQDFIEDMCAFWSDKEMYEVQPYADPDFNSNTHIRLHYKYGYEVPNDSLKGRWQFRDIELPENYGKGEWVARTWEDVKQMAMDFAESVS